MPVLLLQLLCALKAHVAASQVGGLLSEARSGLLTFPPVQQQSLCVLTLGRPVNERLGLCLPMAVQTESLPPAGGWQAL